jgi:predicted NBD/HSP70 family sugar kinase
MGLKSVDELMDIKDSDPIWEIVGGYLGVFCANLCLTMSLEKIVIGGGIMMRGEPLMKHVHKSFLSTLNGYL